MGSNPIVSATYFSKALKNKGAQTSAQFPAPFDARR